MLITKELFRKNTWIDRHAKGNIHGIVDKNFTGEYIDLQQLLNTLVVEELVHTAVVVLEAFPHENIQVLLNKEHKNKKHLIISGDLFIEEELDISGTLVCSGSIVSTSKIKAGQSIRAMTKDIETDDNIESGGSIDAKNIFTRKEIIHGEGLDYGVYANTITSSNEPRIKAGTWIDYNKIKSIITEVTIPSNAPYFKRGELDVLRDQRYKKGWRK